MSDKSDTPRTDVFYSGPCKIPITQRHRNFARELERELNEAKKELADACKEIVVASKLLEDAYCEYDKTDPIREVIMSWLTRNEKYKTPNQQNQ